MRFKDLKKGELFTRVGRQMHWKYIKTTVFFTNPNGYSNAIAESLTDNNRLAMVRVDDNEIIIKL